MKNIFKMAATIIAASTFASSIAYAGGGNGSPSIPAHANANCVQPVLVSETAQLNFGTFAVSPTTGGTIDSSGNATAGVNAVPGTGATPGAFATTGVAGNNYTIQGDSTVTLTDSSKDTMMAALTYPSNPRTLNGSGQDSFNVTGLLTVNAGQVANAYSGTYNVAVHY